MRMVLPERAGPGKLIVGEKFTRELYGMDSGWSRSSGRYRNGPESNEQSPERSRLSGAFRGLFFREGREVTLAPAAQG